MFIPALIAGGAAIGGAMIGAGGSAEANAQNIAFQKQENQWNRGFAREINKQQIELSNTAYQRSKADMVKAGLNPMLMMSQGGAQTPSATSASGVAPQVDNEMSGMAGGISNAVSSALETRRLRKELDATDSQINLNEATAGAAQAKKTLDVSNARVAAKTEAALDAQLPAIAAQSRSDKKRAEFDEKYIGTDSTIKRIRNVIDGVGSAAGILKPKINIGFPRGDSYERARDAGRRGVPLPR